jgi:hypothetical protein
MNRADIASYLISSLVLATLLSIWYYNEFFVPHGIRSLMTVESFWLLIVISTLIVFPIINLFINAIAKRMKS